MNNSGKMLVYIVTGANSEHSGLPLSTDLSFTVLVQYNSLVCILTGFAALLSSTFSFLSFLFLGLCYNGCLVHFLSLLEVVESCSIISSTSPWSVPDFPAPVPVWLYNLETHNLKDLHSTWIFSVLF